MCGFAGVLVTDPDRFDAGEEVLAAMGAILAHRGPDASSTLWSGPCGLVHQRLSIIDLSEQGTQPMTNEDGRVALAYNGEVYNFRELRSRFRLEEKGHHFVSRTDTEVIIHLYEELGLPCVEHLNGMFAFALWDRAQEALHLARDPFGIKPLFYLQTDSALWFASEIKALLLVPGFEARPSLEALHHFLSFDYIPGAWTAFEGIHELRPGHTLTIRPRRDAQPAIRRFYDIEYAVDRAMTEDAAVARSLEVLERAVERQLVSDVPVGVMLSGGMDSSALTALMARARGDADFHTFSIGFDDPSFDESDYARLVADHVGTHHHRVAVTADRVRDLLPRYLSHIDEPYADGSAIPTYLLAEHARDFVTVLLSGEGGDEFFSGYDTHAAYKMRRFYRGVPGFVRRGVIRPLVDLLPVSHKKLSFEFKAKRFARGAELNLPASHFYWRVVLDEDAKRTVLQEPHRFDGFAPSRQLFEEAFAHCTAADELNRLLYIDYSYHLPDDLMIKNDRMTMAHSLEARVPFTDNELVAFLATVPVRYKLKGMRKKHLLRTALRGLLPEVVLEKKKVGLEMPYSRWFSNELRDLGEEMLSARRLEGTGLFDPKGVRQLWDDHLARRADHGRILWGLLNYMLWHELYIDTKNFRHHLTTPRAARAVQEPVL